jgi:hypothetical protein
MVRQQVSPTALIATVVVPLSRPVVILVWQFMQSRTLFYSVQGRMMFNLFSALCRRARIAQSSF